jgi:rRNA maturation endonuclease Nob1
VILMIAGTVCGWAGAGLREALGSKNPLGLLLALGLGAFLAGFILALLGHRRFGRLHCPACQKSLTKDYGGYCSECGSRSLERGSVGFAARCTACGTGWKAPDTLNSRLHFCTHCGVLLIERRDAGSSN